MPQFIVRRKSDGKYAYKPKNTWQSWKWFDNPNEARVYRTRGGAVNSVHTFFRRTPTGENISYKEWHVTVTSFLSEVPKEVAGITLTHWQRMNKAREKMKKAGYHQGYELPEDLEVVEVCMNEGCSDSDLVLKSLIFVQSYYDSVIGGYKFGEFNFSEDEIKRIDKMIGEKTDAE